MKLLVTGGAGFIGSAFIRFAISKGFDVINVDCLTYAANLKNLSPVSDNPAYVFEKANICNLDSLHSLFEKHEPDFVVHLAAESHVDNSISGPSLFIQTNIIGTFNVLQSAQKYWEKLKQPKKNKFRFLHVSTDEVYGDLSLNDPAFEETTPYNPSSPYSASKASSDHLVRAWTRTYGLPSLITNCSNNYGPYQFPEKLIPVTILGALQKKKIPIYGKGENIRDWLHVDDHVQGLLTVLEKGKISETYNIGGNNEWRNLDIINLICDIVDNKIKNSQVNSSKNLIEFITDRAGHDRRYAINSTKIKTELSWQPSISLKTGVEKTIDWYIENEAWWRPYIKNELD